MSSEYERAKERRQLIEENTELKRELAELREQLRLADKELRKWKGAGAYGRNF